MIALLWEGLRGRRDELVAVAVVADVRLSEARSDAIRIQAEHRDGPALEVAAPYRRRRLRRGVEFGEFLLNPGERRVW